MPQVVDAEQADDVEEAQQLPHVVNEQVDLFQPSQVDGG